MKSAIIILAAGFLLFEFTEYVIFPLIWFIKDRKRISVRGVTDMAGKIGEIKYWQESEGQLFLMENYGEILVIFRCPQGIEYLYKMWMDSQ